MKYESFNEFWRHFSPENRYHGEHIKDFLLLDIDMEASNKCLTNCARFYETEALPISIQGT